MHKTHLFLDAEGTLWEPRPGCDFADYWARPTPHNALQVFRLTPGLPALLEDLRRRGATLVVVSRHDEHLLPGLLDAFGIADHFDDVLINGDKGERVAAWLQERGIPKGRALMVGDRWHLDIGPMDRVGIDSVLLDRAYNRDEPGDRVRSLDALAERVLVKVA